jgi:protein phosphatase
MQRLRRNDPILTEIIPGDALPEALATMGIPFAHLPLGNRCPEDYAMSQPTVKALSESDRPTTLDLQSAAGPQAAPLVPRSFGKTDPGRTRPHNEDQFLIATLAKALQVQQTSLRQEHMHYSHERGHLFVVADGMGGHRGGAQASALAVGVMERFILDACKWFFHLQGAEEGHVLNDFRNALQQTDARVIEEARRQPQLWGMGTTLTMAYSLGRDLFLVHVGDSRGYLCRQGHLKQVTRDHTYVQELLDRGHLSPEEASTHQFRHVITNVVGGTEQGVRPEIHRLTVQVGDVLLLCSDGLTEMVSDADIAAVLASVPEPQAACERLIAAANERGGKDNVTVVVVRYDAP